MFKGQSQMCSRVTISKIAQLHTNLQTHKHLCSLFSILLAYTPSLPPPLCLLFSTQVPLLPRSAAASGMLQSSSLFSLLSLSLCTVSLSSLHTTARHWCSADPPTCTCMICEWQVLKKNNAQHRSVYKCA